VTATPQQPSIGQLADRADIPVPTARYYESLGLISSEGTSSNQLRYHAARCAEWLSSPPRNVSE